MAKIYVALTQESEIIHPLDVEIGEKLVPHFVKISRCELKNCYIQRIP